MIMVHGICSVLWRKSLIAYVDLSGHKKKKSVKIPKGYGTTISYMGHHLIKAKSSDQYKLKARQKKIKNIKKRSQNTML